MMRRPATRGLISRAVVTAAAAVALAVPAVAASASQTPVLSWSPSGTYNYGTLTAGQTASQTFTLTNSGGSASGALAITPPGSAAFTKTADTCTGRSLGPRKSCRVTVTYAPTTAGQNDNATLTASGERATASLTLLGASAAKATPALTTAPDPVNGSVGDPLKDVATLSGGSSPTGSIEFKLYGTSNCSGPAIAETVTVSGDGVYETPTGLFQLSPGQYWWVASYSGDSNNNQVVSGCADEPVTFEL